jgi:hypothetical protein
MSNDIKPHTRIRYKYFAFWKNQSTLTRAYLRGASVTGRIGDIQVNTDGSKTMGSSDQKIVHSWDYGNNRPSSMFLQPTKAARFK